MLAQALDRALEVFAEAVDLGPLARAQHGLPFRLHGACTIHVGDRVLTVGVDDSLAGASDAATSARRIAEALVEGMTDAPIPSEPKSLSGACFDLYGAATRWYHVGDGYLAVRLWCPRSGTVTRPRVLLVHPDSDVRLAVAMGLRSRDDALLVHSAGCFEEAALLAPVVSPDLFVIDERLMGPRSDAHALAIGIRRIVIANVPGRRGPGIVAPPESSDRGAMLRWVREELTPALLIQPRRSAPTLPPMRFDQISSLG